MVAQIKNEGSLTARAFWLMFAKTLGFAFSFFLPALLVRHLAQSEYGLFKQAFLIVGTAISVLPLGFGMSAYYFLPRENEQQRKQVVFNILLVTSLVGVLACIALTVYPGLLGRIFIDVTLIDYAPLIGVVILFWVVSSFLEMVAVANQETRLSAIFIISAQLTKALFMLGALFLFGTLRALIYASLAQGILQTAVLLRYLHSRFPAFWREFDLSMLRTQVAYAMPLGLAGLLYTVQTDLHNYFVSHRFGSAEFAIYSIGCLELPLIGLLRESINSVMIPRVSLLQKEGKTDEIILIVVNVMRKLAALFFPAYAFLIVAGREFIALLFTPAYLSSWPIFAINLTLLPFSILILDAVVRAYAEHRYYLLKARVVMFVLLAAGLWFGVARFGLLGAVGTVVLVSLIERIALLFKFGSVLGMSRHDVVLFKDIGKLALAAFVAGSAAAVTRALLIGHQSLFVLMVCGGIFSLVYLAAVMLLKVVRDEEFDFLRERVARLQHHGYWRRAADPLA